MHYVTLRALGSGESHHHIRGYVTDHNGDYLLEIGNTCHADPRLMAFAAMFPEIEEFLRVINSPLASLLLNKLSDTEHTLRNRLRASEYGADAAAH
jgi:hypothetical protein